LHTNIDANGAMCAVAVPRGHHTATMRYRSTSVYLVGGTAAPQRQP